jgi:hypothetical protein
MADLDFSGRTYTSAVVTAVFEGVFDGNDLTVSNLMIDATVSHLGLFSSIETEGAVTNLNIENLTLLGGMNSYAGGLTGQNDGFIKCCSLTASMVSGGVFVGGLVGYNGNDGTVTDCYSNGLVTGEYDVGGLVGANYGNIMNCYSTISAIGGDSVGGLVGENGNVTCSVMDCYSTGSVSGNDDIGGMVGLNFGSVTNSFWDINTSGMATSGGGTGQTTLEMQRLITFSGNGWDFWDDDGDPADWMMLREDEDYPRLAWQTVIAGDIAGLYGVDLVDFAYLAGYWGLGGVPGRLLGTG